MDWTRFFSVAVPVAAAISGMMLGWTARTRDIQREIRSDAGSGARLQADIDYIKRAVDEMRIELRAQGQRIDAIAERLARVEESTKSAHRRIDGMERVVHD